MQTIQMIDQQHLDVRTITMGISLLSCARSDPRQACDAIYDKITRCAENLVDVYKRQSIMRLAPSIISALSIASETAFVIQASFPIPMPASMI